MNTDTSKKDNKMKMKETLSVKDILFFCEQAADVSKNLAEKALKTIGKGESSPSAIGASAYFMQKEEIYRFIIPKIIKHLAKDEQPEECLFGFGTCCYPINECQQCPNRKSQ